MCEKRTSTRVTPATPPAWWRTWPSRFCFSGQPGTVSTISTTIVAAVDRDLAEHPELDDVAAQLGIDHPAHGLADRVLGRGAHGGIVSGAHHASSGWKTSPSSSFGKKYVDFCGIVSPAAATASTSATDGRAQQQRDGGALGLRSHERRPRPATRRR